MTRRLYPESKYPDGHPALARSLNNLGYLWIAMGSHEKALPFFEQSLAMNQKLYPVAKYPDGHSLLALSIHNRGILLQEMGSYEKALPSQVQALAMYRRVGQRMLDSASEAETLAYVKAQPLMRDLFLSLTTHLPDSEVSAYEAVWASKSAITRVLEQRHAAARVAGTAFAAKLDDLKGLRRRIDQLLQDRRLPPAERDKLLTTLTDDRDRLERELATAIPLLQRAKELDALGPDALLPLMRDHEALIDFVLYTRFDFDKVKPGKAGETRTPCYAAFVLANGYPIRRIELGNADPIDRAVAEWRTAIEARAGSSAADKLREFIWAKLEPHLPRGTKTLYLSPDGDLARLPWPALPTSDRRVLLEAYAIATVPHGPFVLETLKYPHTYPGADTTLLLGGVDYNSKTWPNLRGTLTEVKALAALAPSSTTLTKVEATPKQMTQLLPKARYAHFATHGYFDAETLSAEQRLANKALETRSFGDETRRVAAKNPLAFSGLVLADGEVFSGLAIVDLALENLKLVTLSACETGLGEFTRGKGVENLQMAFHLAGCPNVIASLWNVNDAAATALMAKFYYELWINKKPTIEALREAQLLIYRHPELIPDLSVADRGAPKFKEAVTAKADDAHKPNPMTPSKRADTKLWAAFVLSGVGN
jgi:CHAT domain-containing protein